MDQPKIERLLRLLRLLSGNVTYTVDELADRLETSYRSIYRYIDTLKSAGFAVEKVYGNVYRLVSMKDAHIDLSKVVMFSDEEAAIVNGMIDALDNTNALKTGLKRKLAAVYDSTSIANYVGKKSNAANVQAIAEAIKDCRKVVLKDYESSHSGQVRDRLVEPFSFTTNYVDAWCYDLEDGANKRFKIARIGEVEILPDEWTAAQEHRAQPMDAFRMSGDVPIHIKLILSLRAKNLLCEEYPLAEKSVRLEDGRWIYEDDIYALQGAGRFVVSLFHEIEIAEGEPLRQYVEDYLLFFVGHQGQ
ncbi:MAG: WYL domain-containing protein [Bacteroidales bacterium]|nr:WYL domain-containing protein [Bacteroidales bacterium]